MTPQSIHTVVAIAQGCKNLLDANCVPSGATDVRLFDLQKEYIYAVFVNVLLTDIGKQLVRNHTDPQRIYKGLWAHYQESTKALLDSTQLLEYVTTTRLVIVYGEAPPTNLSCIYKSNFLNNDSLHPNRTTYPMLSNAHLSRMPSNQYLPCIWSKHRPNHTGYIWQDNDN